VGGIGGLGLAAYLALLGEKKSKSRKSAMSAGKYRSRSQKVGKIDGSLTSKGRSRSRKRSESGDRSRGESASKTTGLADTSRYYASRNVTPVLDANFKFPDDPTPGPTPGPPFGGGGGGGPSSLAGLFGGIAGGVGDKSKFRVEENQADQIFGKGILGVLTLPAILSGAIYTGLITPALAGKLALNTLANSIESGNVNILEFSKKLFGDSFEKIKDTTLSKSISLDVLTYMKALTKLKKFQEEELGKDKNSRKEKLKTMAQDNGFGDDVTKFLQSKQFEDDFFRKMNKDLAKYLKKSVKSIDENDIKVEMPLSENLTNKMKGVISGSLTKVMTKLDTVVEAMASTGIKEFIEPI